MTNLKRKCFFIVKKKKKKEYDQKVWFVKNDKIGKKGEKNPSFRGNIIELSSY